MLEEILGMPAHPIYVHFPIVFLVSSSLFLVVHLFNGGKGGVSQFFKKIGLGAFDFESFSVLCLLLGFLTGILGIFSGLALVGGWKHIPVPHAPLGIATEVCYFILLVLRWVFGPSLYSKPLKFFYCALHLLGLFLISATGFAGGELHYH